MNDRTDIPAVNQNAAYNQRIERAVDELVDAVMKAPAGIPNDQAARLLALLNGR